MRKGLRVRVEPPTRPRRGKWWGVGVLLALCSCTSSELAKSAVPDESTDASSRDAGGGHGGATNGSGGVTASGGRKSIGGIPIDAGLERLPDATVSACTAGPPTDGSTAPTALWSRGFGSVEGAAATSIAIDRAGNAVVLGACAGDVSFDSVSLKCLSPGQSLFVAKLDGAGTTVWAVEGSTTGSMGPLAIGTTPDGSVVVAGEFSGTLTFSKAATVTAAGSESAFIAKLDAHGETVWVRSYGSAEAQAFSVAAESNGRLLISGIFSGRFNLNPPPSTAPAVELISAGGTDGFVAELDENGVALWGRALGGSGVDSADDVAVDTKGNILVAGHFTSSMVLDAESIAAAGEPPLFVAKLGPGGSAVWLRAFASNDGAGYSFRGAVVAVDGHDDVLLGGSYRSGITFLDAGNGKTLPGQRDYDNSFVAKLDAGGNFVWAEQYVNVGVAGSSGLAVDGAGNALLTGYISAVASSATDAFAAKLSPDGNHIWEARFGDARNQPNPGTYVPAEVANSVAVDSADHVVVAGFFAGPTAAIDFGAGVVTAHGFEDAFVAKFCR